MIRRIIASIAAAAFLAAPAFAEPTRFSVTVTGEGKDVILIPGLASSASVWDATVAQLSSTHRVHVVQVAGFAGAPAGPNAEGDMLAPLVAELGEYAVALDKPAIIGHSIGGLSALEIAAAHDGEIGRVMVVDALPFYPLIFNQAATTEMMAPQAAAMRAQIQVMSQEAFNASQDSGLNIMAKSPEGLAKVKEWSAASDKAAVANALYAAMTTDARPRLKDIKIPVTIAYAWDENMGRTKAFMAAMYITAYSDLATAELKRVDGGYHFIMFDQPELFAAAVSEFLAAK
jgi:pimeloyl-[acyl-carrier protein] methyl ester esterase